MRTLKKTLCLVLALVLCFGLVGTAFAGNFDGYTDADKIDDAYVEAIDVLMGIGVVAGDTATTINPTGTFTREQAAKVLAYIMLGKTAADKLSASSAPFDDVAADKWSAGYIAYCVEAGIIKGYGDGKFGPADELTGYQFAAALLRAVGYGVNGEYEGSGWSIAVAQDAITKNVFKGDLAAATLEPITRAQALLMAYNVLTLVERVSYSELLKQYIGINSSALGTTSEPSYLSENFNLKKHSKDDDYGFGGHVSYTGANYKADGSNTVSEWYMDDVILGTITDASVTGGTLYNNYDFDTITAVIVNGEPDTAESVSAFNQGIATYVKKYNTDTPLSAYAGATIYLLDTTNDGSVDKVVVKYPYLAKVTKVAAASSTDDAYIEMTIDGVAKVKVYTDESFAKGDYLMVVPATNSAIAPSSTIKALSMEKVDVVTSAVSSYNSTKGTFVVGDATYTYAAEATDKVNVADLDVRGTTYDFVFYNGYCWYAKINTDTSTYNYAVLSAITAKNDAGNLLVDGSVAMKVKLTYMDGTSAVLDYAIGEVTKSNLTTIKAGDFSNAVVGDYFYSYKDATGTTKYAEVTTSSSSITGLTVDGLYAYTENSDGAVTLSAKLASNDSAQTTGVKVANAKEVDFDKATAAVVIDKVTHYATSSTTLTVVDTAGTVTTITGYANFKDVRYTAGNIYYVTNSAKVLNSILVVGQAAPAETTFDAYGIYLGTGDVTSAGTYHNFFVDGGIESYLLSDNNAVTPNTSAKYYAIEKDAEGKVVLTAATGVAMTNVTIAGSNYVVGTVSAASTLVNLAEDVEVYDITASNANGYYADSIGVGDNIVYITETVNGVTQIVVAYITTNASEA